MTAKLIADAVVAYAVKYGLEISREANALWDLVEQVATTLPAPFSEATEDTKQRDYHDGGIAKRRSMR